MKGITSEQKEKCLKIIDNILERPISLVFQDPVDPILDEVPDYFDIISRPSDLSTVRQRLVDNKYESMQDFKDDVNLIWENAITYNGRPSLPAYIADELSKYFNKQIAALEDPQVEQWINDFLKTRSILWKLFQNAPKGLSSFTFKPERAIVPDDPSPVHTRISDEDKQFFEE